MSDFTGLSPDKAKNDIEIFEGAGMQVYNIIRDANIKFVGDLSSKWFSDRAVQFATKAMPQMYEAQYNVLQFINNTVIKATAAYNSLASANGLPALSTDKVEMVDAANLPTDTPADFQIDGGQAFKESNGDLVGMYIDDVKQVIMPELTDKIENAKNVYLDRIPDTISFYDPSGEIALAYKNGIQKAKEALGAELTAVYAWVNDGIDYEVDLSQQGAQQAAENMSSGSTQA